MNVWVPYSNSTPEEQRPSDRPSRSKARLKTLRGLRRVESNSSTRGVNVNLVFEPGYRHETGLAWRYGTAWNGCAAVSLPDEINRIWVRKFSSTDIPIMYLSLSWHGDRDALFQVVDEQLIPRIERIDGIAGIDAWGSRARQVIIDLDEDLLKAVQGERGAVHTLHGTGQHGLARRIRGRRRVPVYRPAHGGLRIRGGHPVLPDQRKGPQAQRRGPGGLPETHVLSPVPPERPGRRGQWSSARSRNANTVDVTARP